MTAWSGPMVDAHQHFWEPARGRNPWLAPGAAIPFRYGDYAAIKRPYLPADYRRDAAGHDVVETVYVETEWDPADGIGETRYAAALQAEHGWPNAIVAQAWLHHDDAAEQLARQAAVPLVRSIRHKPGGDGRTPGLMSDPGWRRGYAALARHGLHFDLQAPWQAFAEAEALARDFPETLIVLNHAGLPADRSEAGLRGWREAMARLSDHANLRVKISGLGQRGRPWRAEDNRAILLETVSLFGAARCMIASNFPVDSLCGSLDTIFAGFKAIAADLPQAEQAWLFRDTARAVYRTGGAA
ncbi:thioesterase [Pseudoroseomonas deserti]|uniref:Thioesterase n=1 Tax=Teichococcus deserti TaxID=1817963 RepID=A0A1V2H3M3_9PROT|nr:amidohydrolase family protein [Pseudoroseomonas deserti]ONG54039.1 thioesterase [Pseudoroseomonas deserti]